MQMHLSKDLRTRRSRKHERKEKRERERDTRRGNERLGLFIISSNIITIQLTIHFTFKYPLGTCQKKERKHDTPIILKISLALFASIFLYPWNNQSEVYALSFYLSPLLIFSYCPCYKTMPGVEHVYVYRFFLFRFIVIPAYRNTTWLLFWVFDKRKTDTAATSAAYYLTGSFIPFVLFLPLHCSFRRHATK